MKKSYPEGGRRNIAGIRIRELRKARGLTQEDVAELAQLEGYDITRKVVYGSEAGIRVVADYELITFAKILGTTVEYLLQIEDK